MPWRRHPILYEINTWVWLNELSTQAGRRLTLADVPDATLDALAEWGFDTVWLMGIWERSPRGREIARTLPDLQTEYARALPGYTADDVVGSPYAIHRYVVDPAFGGQKALAALRKRCTKRGLKLLLDYVPNHIAVDHPWATERPGVLLTATPADQAAQPESYFSASSNGPIVAHGRDPYFPAWTDTAQINAFASEARKAATETLLDLAAQCDGVRCDMAMLLLNRVFSHTWRLPAPPTEFWNDVIPAVKAYFPDFLFMAEAYWDTESELHALGFDVVYDKRLYDRLRDKDAAEVRDHLLAPLAYQRKMVRFIENHDEARAVIAFGAERSRAAAVLITFLPGVRMLHDGQLEGRRIKLPVQLGRRFAEAPDAGCVAFYQALLNEAAASPYHDGVFLTLAVNPILGHDIGHEALIAFAWALGDDWRVVIVNDSFQTVKGRVMLPHPAMSGPREWELTDALSGESARLVGDDLLTAGLPVSLKAYGAMVLTMRPC
ncbi:MAG: alpha-amylase family glycosyl hydrolase [Aggregatilineales bacterium]